MAYGDTFSMRLPAFPPLVITSNPDVVREVLSNPGNRFSCYPATRLFDPVFGRDGVFQQDGKEHRTSRKAVMAGLAAHLPNHKSLLEKQFLKISSTWKEGDILHLYDVLHELLARPLLQPFVDWNDEEDLNRFTHEMIEFGKAAADPIRFIFLSRFDRPFARTIAKIADPALSRLFHFRDNVHRRIHRALRECDTGSESLLGYLKREIDTPVSIVSTILLTSAGFSSTASATAWLFYELLSSPVWLGKVQEEISTIPEGEPSPIVDAVIGESLRLHPPLPQTPRSVVETTTLGGYTIPAGTDVAISLYLQHRRPDLWSNPRQFQPGRFLDSTAPGSRSWMPFGFGPHRCAGKDLSWIEMRFLLRALLETVDMEPVSTKHRGPAQRHVQCAPPGGFPVRITRIKRRDHSGEPATAQTSKCPFHP